MRRPAWRSSGTPIWFPLQREPGSRPVLRRPAPAARRSVPAGSYSPQSSLYRYDFHTRSFSSKTISSTRQNKVPSARRLTVLPPTAASAARRRTFPCSSVTIAYPRPRTRRGLKASREAAAAASFRAGSAILVSAAWNSSLWTWPSSIRLSSTKAIGSVNVRFAARFSSCLPRASTLPLCSRSKCACMPRSLSDNSARSGETISAAWVGVAALASATKSAMVTSGSWPTAETIGMVA